MDRPAALAIAWSCLLLVSVQAADAAAGDAPVSNIRTATLDQYRDQYGHSPLCTGDEITLWSCETKTRVFSLCSSPSAARGTGYLQYRASSAGKLTLVYPATKTAPAGLFKYSSYGNGNASVEFSNSGYHYNLFDDLRGKSSIVVTAPGASAKSTEISCGPNQTLQGNYTMRLMADFGLYKDD
jgi:hypothetical protein